MNNLKITFLLLLLATGLGTMNAQDENNPWLVGIGLNAVDFYPTNPQTDWGGNWFNEFVNAEDHWNGIPALSRFTVGRYIDDGFIFEIDGAINIIGKMGDMPVNDMGFWSLDGVVKWSINSVANIRVFDPYILLGGGYTWVGDYDTAALNAGVGFNIWLSDRVGLNFENKLRQSFESELKAHFQWSFGVAIRTGGKDTDGDGVYDKHDDCPEIFGLSEFNGCPDSDGDGIMDSEDNCPDVAGLMEYKGCPDTDGDGIIDSLDACLNEKGTKENKGCPDTDDDGVVDKDDKCPQVVGPVANNGCPWPDTDGDGVADKDDHCKELAGPASNNGCPIVTSAVLESLKELARTVYFDSSKATFKAETFGRLDLILEILEKYPNEKFHVEGHTDATGSEGLNQKLSDKRANAVRDYLISKGINGANLTAQGYGESQPIETNATRSGRAMNRRVEIKLVK